MDSGSSLISNRGGEKMKVLWSGLKVIANIIVVPVAIIFLLIRIIPCWLEYRKDMRKSKS